MTIYFLRHASAGKKYVNAKRDEKRPLDEPGILQARYVGRLLSSMEIQLDQIISSPLKRAMQTASLAANELAFETGIQVDAALRPESEYEQFQELLARYSRQEAIMVVGHNPSLSEFLSKTISSNSGATHVNFKKGAVAKVEMSGRTGTLEWLITPRIARTLQATLKASSRPKTSRK
jgi:phosphohistidine phosphatase